MTEDELLGAINLAAEEGNISVANELAAAHKKMFPFQEARTPADVESTGFTDIRAFVPGSNVEAIKKGNFIEDQSRAGIADLVFSLIPDTAMNQMFGLDMADYQAADGTFDTVRAEADLEAAKEEARQKFFSYRGTAPSSGTEKFIGTGVRGAVSEGPLAFAGARSAAGGASELMQSLFASMFGASGGQVGAETAEAIGFGRTVQEITGALTGAAVGGSSTAAGRTLSNSAYQTGKNVFQERSRVIESADKAADYMATSEIGQIISNATKAQPDIDSVIKATQDLEQLIPGLVIPPAATLSENPIYRKNTEYLLRSDPNFYATMRDQLKDAKAAIDMRIEQRFGKTGPEVEARIRSTLPKDYGKDIRNAKKRIEAIDAQLSAVSSTLRSTEDVSDVGRKVDNLMTAKVNAVTKRLSPEYTKTINNGERLGIDFPPSSVGRIYETFKLLQADDVFATFPSLMSKINNEWSPQKVEPSLILTAEGRPIRAGGGLEFNSAPLKELDSFKRELNKAIRTTSDSGQLRKLNAMKTVLKEEISAMPEQFSKPYQALDSQFYKELGIPFDSAELSQLSSARFSSSAGAYLAKPDQAAEFLSFVGDVGVPVVKDAIYLKMANSGVFKKNGMVDPQNINKFLLNNKKLIDTVPGLKNELQDTKRFVERLTETQARMDAQYNAQANKLADGFYKGISNKGISGVADSILSSPAGSEKYLNDIRNFEPETAKMARQGIRAELVTKAMKSNKTMNEFINENQNVFNSWFGKTYVKDIQAIADASDILRGVNVNNMRFATDFRQSDALSERTGVSFTQLQSVLRDRITNAGTKAAILGSKMSVASSSAKRDAQLMDLLLNPSALAELRQKVEANKFKATTPELVAQLANITNRAVSKGVYFGLVGSEQEEPERVPLSAAGN